MLQHVLVVDDFVSVCDGIAALIEKAEGIGKVYTAYHATEALKIVRSERIHAALIDARMPDTNGIALISLLQTEYPTIKLIGMTSYDDDTVVEVLRTGVPGFLLKRSTDRAEINLCLREVLAGRTYYTAEVQSRLNQNGYNLLKPIIQFTKREMEMLPLLCAGQSTKQIADHLGLKEYTIEDYRKELLRKTNTKNVAERASYVHRNGIL